ncbi:ABC transporter permease, partial [Agrobacterium tumefaciens]|uniref:ABC transporter permease n=1 Tax=Agrobacterium tumefaciens TaxID=358 RepID=UPI003C6C0350
DGWSPPLVVPKDYTTARWASIMSDGSLIRAAVNSIVIAIVVTFLTAVIALPTAWAMARFPFRLKRLVEIFILAPIIIPGLVVAVGIGQVFLLFGLAYSVTGVILVQIVGTLPLMIRLMTAARMRLPSLMMLAQRAVV